VPDAGGPPQRPEDVRFIPGVILVSRQAERVEGFYRDVLGRPLAGERHGDTQPHWGCEPGDIHFAIHPAEDYPEDPVTGPRPVKVAFMAFDLPGMISWPDHPNSHRAEGHDLVSRWSAHLRIAPETGPSWPPGREGG
jgi:hypothetical protein